MATRNVQFNFAANASPTDNTDHMVLSVYDSTGAAVFTSPALPRSAITLTQQLAVQNGYAVRLVAYSAAGTPSPGSASGLPFVLFNVTAPPPPVAPGDPTLAQPVLL